MNPVTREKQDSFGLLATGVSGRWTVDLDESSDGAEWSLQLDGPNAYFVIEVQDLAAIRMAAEYLRAPRPGGKPATLGCFASNGVTFYWDDEFTDRCFLIIGPSARAAMRLTLSAEDANSLADAFEQIAEELPA